MMRPSNDLPAIYVCVDPVDFRKQINGLAAVVQDVLALDPFSEHLFAFTNRRKTHCRVLYWERSGFVLWTKRLEKQRFAWPHAEAATLTLTAQEFNWLLDGFDLSQWRPHQRLHYDFVA